MVLLPYQYQARGTWTGGPFTTPLPRSNLLSSPFWFVRAQGGPDAGKGWTHADECSHIARVCLRDLPRVLRLAQSPMSAVAGSLLAHQSGRY